MEKYQEVFDRSLNSPEKFWAEAAEAISWYKKWDVVLDSSDPPFYRWFRGGELNTCYNAVDRHVENGHGDRTAVIYDSPVTDTVRKISWAELRDQVARLAGALKKQGAEKGDTIYHLYAHDSRGPGRHAGLCPTRCYSFCRVRRLCS